MIDEGLVKAPNHYGGYECLDQIKEALTEEEFVGFLKGTAMRYEYRAGKKPGNSAEQDEAKAVEYRTFLHNHKLKQPWGTDCIESGTKVSESAGAAFLGGIPKNL